MNHIELIQKLLNNARVFTKECAEQGSTYWPTPVQIAKTFYIEAAVSRIRGQAIPADQLGIRPLLLKRAMYKIRSAVTLAPKDEEIQSEVTNIISWAQTFI